MWAILWKKISSLIESDTIQGLWSSQKFSFLFNDIFTTLLVGGVWGYVSLKAHALQNIPEGVLVFYATVLSISHAGKYLKNKTDAESACTATPVVPVVTNDQ